MDKILAPIKQRILKYIEFKGYSKGDFFENLGVSASNFRSKSLYSEINGEVIAKISSNHSDINLDWLLTGEGEMINHPPIRPEWYLTGQGDMLEENAKDSVPIPLIPTSAFAGLGGGEVAISEHDIQDRYVIPDFVNVDFMIRVSGSSMYPKYNSGDVVACKMINENSFIQWNKVHVVATREQGVLIKRLRKSNDPDCLLAVSDNPDYDAFNIPKKEILNIALVTGVIRIE